MNKYQVVNIRTKEVKVFKLLKSALRYADKVDLRHGSVICVVEGINN